MEATAKIHLTEEKETLFITLFAKAADYHAKHSILQDKAAYDILKTVDYDFTKLKGFGNNIIVIRAKQFDEWIIDFINVHTNAVVIYLGCGLDTRINRINPSSTVSWFDVDYPEVIQLRKEFYTARKGYTMIESSVTAPGWFEQIPNDRPVLVIAEGVLEYLAVEDVKILLTRITDYFQEGQILFDVMNSFAIKSGKENLKNMTGAVHKWAVDNPDEVDQLNPGLKRITVLPLFKSPYIKKLPVGFRLLLRCMSVFPQFKNMMRLMRYHFYRG